MLKIFDQVCFIIFYLVLMSERMLTLGFRPEKETKYAAFK